MKFAFMQNPLTQILFFAWIYNSFIISHLLEWLKLRQIKSGIKVNFDQCGTTLHIEKITTLKHVRAWVSMVFTSDEPEPEFSSSSRAELWRFWAEPSWGTSISELKPSWQVVPPKKVKTT